MAGSKCLQCSLSGKEEGEKRQTKLDQAVEGKEKKDEYGGVCEKRPTPLSAHSQSPLKLL